MIIDKQKRETCRAFKLHVSFEFNNCVFWLDMKIIVKFIFEEDNELSDRYLKEIKNKSG